MKKLFFILLSVFVPMIAFSQYSESVDPKAKSLLDKAVAVMENKKGMEVQFKIDVLNTRSNKSESFNGDVLLKGEKFKLSLQGVNTYFDGKVQSVHMVKEKEVTISAPEKEDLKDVNPLLLMKSYKTDFKMRYMGASTYEGKLCEEVELYPNDLNSDYSIIHLMFEKKSMMLQSITLRGKGGIHTHFEVVKATPKDLNDAEFTFDTKKFPDVEVVDLR
ncbi:MAG: outer membrane lipoprotein carrier protein LolA [Paludibacteraceae bacterium]|nr:outer membrane lipoprotein carrier protein LolA [Paludibacteraceae bacterium]